jgi:hypothetical protein
MAAIIERNLMMLATRCFTSCIYDLLKGAKIHGKLDNQAE